MCSGMYFSDNTDAWWNWLTQFPQIELCLYLPLRIIMLKYFVLTEMVYSQETIKGHWVKPHNKLVLPTVFFILLQQQGPFLPQLSICYQGQIKSAGTLLSERLPRHCSISCVFLYPLSLSTPLPFCCVSFRASHALTLLLYLVFYAFSSLLCLSLSLTLIH